MELSSPAFENNGLIPEKYTCEGENVNPLLVFLNVPADAKSLALIVNDIDVPAHIRPDGIWNHWLIWDMPPDTEGIPEGVILPPGVSGHTTGGETRYQGPCPPDREHRYVFTLYALDTVLNLDKDNADWKDARAAMQGHIVAQADLVGTYDMRERRGV